MLKIGVVLSGCAGKGAYEIGCMQALWEFFGMENIRCISSASMGSLVGHAFALDRRKELDHGYRELDSGKFGRQLLSISTNKGALQEIANIMGDGTDPKMEHFVSVWNFTKGKVEYVPFHTLSGERLMQYAQAAISIPIFSRGVIIDEERMLDGAFLDNIPVYPLVDKELDIIFCVYFDNESYVFESDEFDRKIVKLNDFPNAGRLETLVQEIGSYDRQRNYGYEYTNRVLKELFDGKPEDQWVKAVAECRQERQYKKRLTVDVVLNGINAAVKNYSGVLTKRKKAK